MVYHTADGWKGRIDTNNDLNFDDEVELFNTVSRVSSPKSGKKKSLTVNMDILPDGRAASLAFDDGSHGTHVSGIATGYDPAGLQGVAPGAQLVVGKLGDNRLTGGSTTTASMMLSIDFAVESGAQIVNMSYGIRAGSNLGTSAIDKYVDKIARDKGIIFSISAGNEGPGLLTVGVPAAADLAISNAAYLSKNTARENYGYLGVEDDRTWYFSSVGPRLDGGFKPSLLSPGTALSRHPPLGRRGSDLQRHLDGVPAHDRRTRVAPECGETNQSSDRSRLDHVRRVPLGQKRRRIILNRARARVDARTGGTRDFERLKGRSARV